MPLFMLLIAAAFIAKVWPIFVVLVAVIALALIAFGVMTRKPSRRPAVKEGGTNDL